MDVSSGDITSTLSAFDQNSGGNNAVDVIDGVISSQIPRFTQEFLGIHTIYGAGVSTMPSFEQKGRVWQIDQVPVVHPIMVATRARISEINTRDRYPKTLIINNPGLKPESVGNTIKTNVNTNVVSINHNKKINTTITRKIGIKICQA